MKPIKVVHINNLDVGLKVHLGNYMRYQRAQGYAVSAICHPGRWLKHDSTILDGLFVKIIPFQPRISPLADLKTLARLARYFRRERFDIVHTHTVKPGLLGGLAARLTGVPVVVHTLHGLYLHDGMPPRQYKFFSLIEKVVIDNSHSILSQNTEDIQTVIKAGICPPDKISHLGNGIDLSQFYPGCVPAERTAALRTELGVPADHHVIGLVARLVREKGIFEFIEAARLLKEKGVKARYVMIGSSQKDKASAVSPEDLIRRHGLDGDMLILGHRDDVPALMSLMDLIVLPSYAEGVPRILMEAAAMGKPCVATRVRGTVEVVVDGETGVLVPVRDAPGLAGAIARVLADPDRAAEMGRRTRQRALKHFDENFFFWKTDAEYRKLMAARMKVDPAQTLKPIPQAAP